MCQEISNHRRRRDGAINTLPTPAASILHPPQDIIVLIYHGTTGRPDRAVRPGEKSWYRGLWQGKIKDHSW